MLHVRRCCRLCLDMVTELDLLGRTAEVRWRRGGGLYGTAGYSMKRGWSKEIHPEQALRIS